MSIKINKLEIENVKRIKAVKIEPTLNGLTVIGGNNNQGKTSVLDSIAWALGGDKFKPSSAQRDGSVIPPNLHIVMSNGLVIDRKGKNSDLKVTDPDGQKGGQQLLNDFVEQLAIDLPRFMQSTPKEKADTLLKIIGVGGQLAEFERKEKEIYNQRTTIGQIADQKKKYAKEQPYYPEAPKDPVSASDLIRSQQAILAKNGENQKKRDKIVSYKNQYSMVMMQIAQTQKEIELLEGRLRGLTNDMNNVLFDIETAEKSAIDLRDEGTEELERSLEGIEEINRMVRANLDKDKAEEDALQYEQQYGKLTVEINNLRQAKIDLLKDANLPLPGLSVVDGELTYNGYKWDGISGSDQLKVATAIVRKLNPKCGFVLLDKLEQMDLDTLNEFGAWLEQEGLQAIATRVSTGEECSVIISDGYVVDDGKVKDYISTTSVVEEKMTWKAGEF